MERILRALEDDLRRAPSMFEEFRNGSYRAFREAWNINERWLRSLEGQIPSDIDSKLRDRIEDLISKSRQFFNDVDKWFRDNHGP